MCEIGTMPAHDQRKVLGREAHDAAQRSRHAHRTGSIGAEPGRGEAAATAAVVPLLEPPEMRVRSYGLRVGPNAALLEVGP